uniref:PPUP9358 n=1 Tax=Poeciliopsis prolifica TaxID=188132 RepID=A0A0S7EMZ4_9TELE
MKIFHKTYRRTFPIAFIIKNISFLVFKSCMLLFGLCCSLTLCMMTASKPPKSTFKQDCQHHFSLRNFSKSSTYCVHFEFRPTHDLREQDVDITDVQTNVSAATIWFFHY